MLLLLYCYYRCSRFHVVVAVDVFVWDVVVKIRIFFGVEAMSYFYSNVFFVVGML